MRQSTGDGRDGGVIWGGERGGNGGNGKGRDEDKDEKGELEARVKKGKEYNGLTLVGMNCERESER